MILLFVFGRNEGESIMGNPWEEISLEDYENHMCLDSVKQLQAMNSIMKNQFDTYTVDTAMVLGVAGGNGLEHVSREKFRTVYGVDINEEYLRTVSKRYSDISDILKCLRIDLINEANRLPHAQFLIANLLIEYVGYEAFQNVVRMVAPEYVSCVIQINTDEKEWVSDSPYIHAFDRLDEVHHQMEEESLSTSMMELGYKSIVQTETPLPNGKALLRIDYKKE